jgi:hypothetical protein
MFYLLNYAFVSKYIARNHELKLLSYLLLNQLHVC